MNVWPAPLALYTEMLANVTDILLSSGAKHVLYALTTPFQADALPSCGKYCNAPASAPLGWPQPTDGGNGRCGPPICAPGSLGCGVPNATAKAQSPDPSAPGCGPPSYAVRVLNEAAAGVMAGKGVPTLDLGAVVHAHCGANYSSCDWCDNETQYLGIDCGYHYAPAGVAALASAVAEKLTEILDAPNTQ